MERKEFLKKVLAYGRQAGFADCEAWRFAETSTGGQAMPIPSS